MPRLKGAAAAEDVGVRVRELRDPMLLLGGRDVVVEDHLGRYGVRVVSLAEREVSVFLERGCARGEGCLR